VQGSGVFEEEDRRCVSREALEPNALVGAVEVQCECFVVVGDGEGKYHVPVFFLFFVGGYCTDGMPFEGACLDIAGEFGVQVEEFVRFNGWVGLDCEESLYAGVREESLYAGVHEGGSCAVCVSMVGSLTRGRDVLRSTSTGLPICKFDPEKGEYVCPEATVVEGKGLGGDGEVVELK
jgi:hypothetical protein